MYFIGLCFEYGLFTNQDLAEATILYWKASEKDHHNAKTKLNSFEKISKFQSYNLALDYKFGFKVPEDHRIAAVYFLEAAKKGYFIAMHEFPIYTKLEMVSSQMTKKH